MTSVYEETEDIIPRISFKLLTIILIVTDLFVLGCTVGDIIEGWWQFAVVTVVFAALILICNFVKIWIRIDEENISVKMFKTYTVPLSHVIDVKKGDIDITRNYSGWGIKKVKFKNYTAPGFDWGVSVKLTGRTVLTVTTAQPEELFNILYSYRRQD